MAELLKTVDQVKETLNPGLAIHGIVLTMFDARNNLSSQVVADVREFMGKKISTASSPAMCGSLRHRPTESRFWFTISNAQAAKLICAWQPR